MYLDFRRGINFMRVGKYFNLIRNIPQLPRFFNDYINFKKNASNWDCRFSDLLPILSDSTSTMGFDAHYVYHTGWAARVLQELGVKEHVDISSSIMFCSIASAFVSMRHYDYRQPILTMSRLECGSQDLCNLTFSDDSIESLSCMHVIEHIGLGRYGDPINAVGDELAAKELVRVLSPGGNLLIVLPVAERARVRFNGHRIYSFQKVIKLFSDLELCEFTFLNEARDNRFTRNANQLDIIGSEYGCGCFVFRKPKNP
jgi:SAM-dependent methyltransferase